MWELAIWRRSQADAGRPLLEREVERARSEFLLGRSQRMQIECLVKAAAALERRRSERREQSQLDEWYGSGTRSAVQRARLTDSASPAGWMPALEPGESQAPGDPPLLPDPPLLAGEDQALRSKL